MAERERGKLNRRQQRDLDIEIGFLEGLVRREPGYEDALRLLGEDYTRRGRYAEGLQVDRQLTQLRPEDPLTHYNLACSHALLGQPEAVFAALNLALDRGFHDFRWLARDPDLSGFRKHPLYRQLLKRVKTLKAQAHRAADGETR
jgi:tetratricopeptide (TPR) repeat protein